VLVCVLAAGPLAAQERQQGSPGRGVENAATLTLPATVPDQARALPIEVSRFARALERRIAGLAAGLVPPVEAVRAQAELMRRQQAELLARQRWRLASADLVRVLNLGPSTQLEPIEPPHLRIALIDPGMELELLLALAQAYWQELAGQAALLAAAAAQVKQEQLRPLLPNLVLRGASTNPAGTPGVGVFGGGINGNMSNFGGRWGPDVQLLWQLDNLGLGNRARVRQRQAETQAAAVELARSRATVAAEVTRALAELRLARQRMDLAERRLRLSQESLRKNLAGIRQTRRIGDTITVVVRPQEAVAAVQALAQAYLDYYGAIADANRAQFRLYRALGQPAQSLLCHTAPPVEVSAEMSPHPHPPMSGGNGTLPMPRTLPAQPDRNKPSGLPR
jgi:outer membrane protein TolC